MLRIYRGIMENKTESTIVCRGYIGIMETTIVFAPGLKDTFEEL